MSVIGEIRGSLDAIGFEQQAFLFAFLASYPLTLGGLLASRGRRIAGITATASMIGFTIATDPWIHGVLVVVVIVAGMGMFIAAVWALDQLQRAILRDRAVLDTLQADALDARGHALEAVRERDGGRRPKLPLTEHAGTT
jgi:hypothetical protein